MHLINLTHLTAAIQTAASNDIRYYLNGILVEENILVSTDDSVLSAYLGEESPKEDYLPNFIIPLDAAKKITALKLKTGAVTKLADGRLDIEGVVFTSADGKFPDWRRVVSPAAPEANRKHEGQLDPAQLTKFFKIAKVLGEKRISAIQVVPGTALSTYRIGILNHSHDFIGVIMPYKPSPNISFGAWQ